MNCINCNIYLFIFRNDHIYNNVDRHITLFIDAYEEKCQITMSVLRLQKIKQNSIEFGRI